MFRIKEKSGEETVHFTTKHADGVPVHVLSIIRFTDNKITDLEIELVDLEDDEVLGSIDASNLILYEEPLDGLKAKNAQI